MLKLNLLLLIFGIFLCGLVSAQTRISGRVIDAKTNSPVSGATVSVKNNTNISTATAEDGSFSINAPANARLVVSFIGYKRIELAASAASAPIRLSQGEATLNEVVVVGYGTSLRRDITGSVAKVSARDINNTPVTSFESAIQGRASGVFVQQQNGKVGQGINIRIRGASSISAGNEPLYVVDGIPLTSDNLSSSGSPTNALADININDIESIEILKDASSAAIYGSRASNGVVIITTKKGKAGSSKIEFGYFTGIQKPTRKREFLNPQQYIDFFRQAAVGRGKIDFQNDPTGFASVQEAIDARIAAVESRFDRYSAGTDWKTGQVNTDWQDQAFQRAPISQYDISVLGGNEKTKIYASGQYLDQKGILIKNAYKRYSGRLNMDHQVKDWLTVGMNMNFARSENNRLSDDNAFSTPLQMVALAPITPVIDPRTGLLSGALDLATGAPNTNYPTYYNGLLSVENSSFLTKVNRSIGNVYGNINITKGLSFRSEFSLDQLNQTEKAYYGRLTARNTGVSNGYASYRTTSVLNLNTNNYLHYNTTFNDLHNVDVVGGMSFQKLTNEFSISDAQDFPSDAYKELASGATKIKASTASTENSLLSYFLRANYKFNDKYLIAISGRADGSSRFGVNNRYGFFPAASVGWIVTKERFLEKSTWLSFLKLKASYGLTGNQNIPDFASRSLYVAAGYGGVAGQRPSQLGNPNLKWESTEGVDVGLEASVFKNRVSLEVDLYKRNTRDLLLNVEVPGTSGFATQFTNKGNLNNKGIEVSVNSTNVASKDFRWTSMINFSANRNKVTNLGGQVIGTSVNKAMEGQPLGVFVAKEFAGADPANGDAIYYTNTLKDGVRDRTTTNDINQAEDVIIGNPNPKFIYGLGNTFTYRGFDLDVLLQGVYGNQIFFQGGQYMSSSGSNGYDNQTTDQLRAWKNPGDITDVPEARLGLAVGTDPSSRYISTGSYLRVKSISLGYNLSARVAGRLKLDRLRVYVRAVNPFTITKYEGWDPEVTADYLANNTTNNLNAVSDPTNANPDANINQGVDFYSAPQAKSIVFGLNIRL